MAKAINLAAADTPALNAEDAEKAHRPPVAKQSAGEDLQAFRREAQEFGTKDGDGKKQFVKFARNNVRGGTLGVLSAAAKGPKEHDHARMLYTDFTNASDTASDAIVTEKAAKSLDVQVSKVRAFIRLGNKMEGGALSVFDRALGVHRELVKKGAELKYPSTYTSLYNVAVKQLKNKDATNPKVLVPLPDATIRDLMLAPIKPETEITGHDLLVNAIKLVDSAIKGRDGTENRKGRDRVDSPAVAAARDALYFAVQSVAPEKIQAMEDEIAAAAQRKIDAANKKAADEKARAEAKAARDAEKAKAALENETGVNMDEAEGDEAEDMDVEAMMEGEQETE